MRLTSPATLAVWLASTLSSAQNCPLHGPAYPAPTDLASPAFVAAKAKWDEALASHPNINTTAVSFAVEIYSAGSNAGTIHRSYNTADHQKDKVDVGPETLFRVHSISQAITVYTILSKLGYKHWHDPVTKWVSELVRPVEDPVSDVDWDEVTLGSLASLMSGISRGFAFSDASTMFPEFPGLRKLEDHEKVTCGSVGLEPCSREEAMQYIQQTWPVSQSFQTPNYSNMAFQILAYAVEKTTGMPFPELVTTQLIEPLNLTRTFVTHPGDDHTNAVIEDGWDYDFGDNAPMGGYFSALSDLTTLGRSILDSTLLPPVTTRKWLKPLTHTSATTFSLGSPWEIIRPAVRVSPDSHKRTNTNTNTNPRTRTVDLYTKQGGGGPYTSLLGLSPDHAVGLSILTAGAVSSLGTFLALRQLFVDIWLPAAEQAARDQAGAEWVGSYTFEAGDGGGENNRAEVALLENEPAICLTELVSNGTDVLETIRENSSQLVDGVKGEMRLWLYPMGLVAAAGGGKRIAFRGVAGLVGREVDVESATPCGSWAEGDRIRWGNYPADMFIFETGADGRAMAVEAPALGLTFRRAEE